MEKIIDRGFSGKEIVFTDIFDIIFMQKRGELGPVPAETFCKVVVEKMYLFGRCGDNAWMFYQIVIERSGSTALTANNHKIWHKSYRIGHYPIQLHRIPGIRLCRIDSCVHRLNSWMVLVSSLSTSRIA